MTRKVLEIGRLALLFVLVSSQAPQDVSQYCKDNSLVPDYPKTVKALMDSWSYQYLLGDSGVWQSISIDQYNDSNWMSLEGNEQCAQRVQVQEPTNFPQDNWLITQHIAKSIAQQSDLYPTLVYVNLTFKIDSSCTDCHDVFQLLVNKSDTLLSNVSNITSEFSLVSNLTHSSGNPSVSTMVTKTFVMQPEDDGFYLALKDYGSNITVSRFLVYRLIGPAKQLGLTLFPETPAPTLNCTQVTGVCVANANTTNGMLPLLNLDPDGSWTHSEDQCYCIEGHELVMLEGSDQCQACSPGKYKFLKDNSECLNCPMNSFSSVHGASVCTCMNGFYRAPSETPDHQCTQPPGAPRNLQTSDVTNTSVQLTWDSPSYEGGRSDTFYNVYTSIAQDLIKSNTDPVYGNNFFVTGLVPNSFHQVSVVAENGVSSQAGQEYLRTAITFVTTLVGVPLQVVGVYVRKIDNIIEWLPSSSVHGPIVGYEVQLFSPEAEGKINSVDQYTVMYMVNVTRDLPLAGQPVNVRVRALTGTGPGQWSENELFAQINPLAPTSLSSLVPSTALSSSSQSTSPGPTHSVTMASGSISTTSATTTTTTTTTTKSTTISTSSTPTQQPDNPNPLVSIIAVVGGAIGILILVAVGAFVFFIIRQIRLKKIKKQEDTDYVPLVHYNVSENEDNLHVELKQ